MAVSLVFRAGANVSDSSDRATNIQLCPGKEFTVGRGARYQPPFHNLVTSADGRSCMHLDSGLVSKNHFRIYTIQYEDDDGIEPMFYCEDSGSSNGTYVNNFLIGRHKKPGNAFLLSDGDTITLKPSFSFEFNQPAKIKREEMDILQLEETASFVKRYSVTDRLLGSGHYGKVYLATEVATRRQLACKVVNLRAAAAAVSDNGLADALGERAMGGNRGRLMREVEILTMLNHPNIVSMKKAFRSENNLYLFMELAPGGDLFSFVSANGGCLTDLASRIILRQIAVAVQYLHSIGIVHRDIKPENILMMNTALGHRVALTDFGSAANLRGASRMDSLVGTLDYVAPEVHRTERLYGTSYTKAVDMWSLGIVALCLLTGDSLASYQEMKHISQKDIATRLRQPRPDPENQNQFIYLTNRAKDFLTRLLALEPTHRMTASQALGHCWFTHPSEVARDLDHLYTRSLQGWVPRTVANNSIESIPRYGEPRSTIKIKTLQSLSQADSDDSHQASQKEQRLSRKDPTASVYFSLDKHTRKHSSRHVSTKVSTQRSKQQIINTLRESGELFVKNGDVSTYTSPKRKRSRTVPGGVRDVPPTDLFGNVPAGVDSQQSRSKKTSKLGQWPGDVVIRSSRVDSSQTQLEQPSLLTSEALSLLCSSFADEDRARKRRRVDTPSIGNLLTEMADDDCVRPDSCDYDSFLDEMGDYNKDGGDV